MWRQCRGTGKHSEPGLTLPFFTPLSIKEESRTTAYQKDFIESQSMEDSSKNPEWYLAFRGTALPGANSKSVSHFSTFSPRNIQPRKADEMFSPRWAAPAPSEGCWGLHCKGITGSSSLPGGKEEKPRIPLGTQGGELLASPRQALAKRVCRISAPELQKSPISTVRGTITGEVDYFFEMTLFLMLLSSNI